MIGFAVSNPAGFLVENDVLTIGDAAFVDFGLGFFGKTTEGETCSYAHVFFVIVQNHYFVQVRSCVQSDDARFADGIAGYVVSSIIQTELGADRTVFQNGVSVEVITYQIQFSIDERSYTTGTQSLANAIEIEAFAIVVMIRRFAVEFVLIPLLAHQFGRAFYPDIQTTTNQRFGLVGSQSGAIHTEDRTVVFPRNIVFTTRHESGLCLCGIGLRCAHFDAVYSAGIGVEIYLEKQFLGVFAIAHDLRGNFFTFGVVHYELCVFAGFESSLQFAEAQFNIFTFANQIRFVGDVYRYRFVFAAAGRHHQCGECQKGDFLHNLKLDM